MPTFTKELWFAARSLLRQPGFSLTNVLTLGLATGACATIYSVVYGVTVQPLPYPRASQIVQLWQVDAKGQPSQFSYPNFADIRDGVRSFRAVAQFKEGSASAMVGTRPVPVRTVAVSRDFFDVLGVEPALGRRFVDAELQVGAAPVAIVSWSFWQQQLGGAVDLSTGRLQVRGEPHTIVGVMPRGFAFPVGVDIWLPREATPINPFRTSHNTPVVARLTDGATLESARREGSTVARRLKTQYGEDTWMADLAIVPLRDQLVGDVRPTLHVLFAAVGLLLVIACANLSNLLLVRLAGRARELSVRFALGASRTQVAFPLIAETLILAALGGLFGLALTSGGVRAVQWLAPNLPRIEEVRTNWTVAAFALAISMLSGLGLSLVGAVTATRRHVVTRLRVHRGTASSWTRSALVVTQMAVTIVLLVSAGLLGRSFLKLLDQNPGFRTEGLLAIDLSTPAPVITPTLDRLMVSDPSAFGRQARRNEQLIQRLSALPGTVAVGGVYPFPMSGGGSSGLFAIVRDGDRFETLRDLQALRSDPSRIGTAEFRVVSAGYFRAMGIPLLRGRLFDDRDGADAPHVAVISESLAKSRWPDQDPIGIRTNQAGMDGDFRPLTIVGIVGDIRERGLDADPRPTFYADYRQRPLATFNFTFVLHTTVPPTSLVAPARAVIGEIAPDVPPRFRTIEDVIGSTVAGRRFTLMVVGLFATGAMLLATLGVYGVLSYAVSQRVHEFAVRMALGASARTVVRLVLREALTVLIAALLIGVTGAAAASRMLQGMLFGVTSADPLTYVIVLTALSAVSLTASLFPALRATSVEPLAALRDE